MRDGEGVYVCVGGGEGQADGRRDREGQKGGGRERRRETPSVCGEDPTATDGERSVEVFTHPPPQHPHPLYLCIPSSLLTLVVHSACSSVLSGGMDWSHMND